MVARCTQLLGKTTCSRMDHPCVQEEEAGTLLSRLGAAGYALGHYFVTGG